MTNDRHSGIRAFVIDSSFWFRISSFTFAILSILTGASPAADVTSTKHNLTSSGPGPVRVGGGTEACIYCHTPHSANPVAPLWNRADSGQFYQTYDSSTLQAQVGQPSGASRLCLSCHDGTIALGQTFNPRNASGSTVHLSPGDAGFIGTDLRDDHPISFPYDSALAARNNQLRNPTALPPELPLDHNRQLQCTTCHDPHDDRFTKFLRMDNLGSAMCVTCHELDGWQNNPHALSNAALQGDEWSNIPRAQTVRQAACESCHRPHSGGGMPRLLRREIEEDNCYVCHDGSVASDIKTQQFKLSRHEVDDTLGIHDPVEEPRTMRSHVECADCHNPHAMTSQAAANAPFIKPSMRGASGMDRNGAAVASAEYEYQVCYKCHGGPQAVGRPIVARVIPSYDVSEEFAPENPSFHPVETQGRNNDVPSLLNPWTRASVLYCTHCHASNTTDENAQGPHGSDFEPLLVANYTTNDNTMESPQAYALCYTCHSRDSILSDASFPLHNRHIVETNTSCSICHDSHGIPATSGNVSNNSYLINFDSSVVQADPATGRLEFRKLGTRSGECYLTCHGVAHSPLSYPADLGAIPETVGPMPVADPTPEPAPPEMGPLP